MFGKKGTGRDIGYLVLSEDLGRRNWGENSEKAPEDSQLGGDLLALPFPEPLRVIKWENFASPSPHEASSESWGGLGSKLKGALFNWRWERKRLPVGLRIKHGGDTHGQLEKCECFLFAVWLSFWSLCCIRKETSLINRFYFCPELWLGKSIPNSRTRNQNPVGPMCLSLSLPPHGGDMPKLQR